MNLKKALLGLMVASSFGAIALPAQAEVDIILNFGPPPLRYERVPEHRRGYVWESGYWRWNGHRHVWVAGNWVRERPGYAHRAPHWVERDGRWQYQSRRWDRDGDGIRNSRDRDRDGDGVPNRLDRRPDNPNRR